MTDEAPSRASPSSASAASRSDVVPAGLRAPDHVRRGRSPRLDATADALLELRAEGHRVLALRGQAGEGKSQVLRQIVAAHDGYYVSLGDCATADEALRHGLSLIVEKFGEPRCDARPLPVVCAMVRDILYRQYDDPLIVIDGLDAPCPADVLKSLLDPSRGGAVIVAGPGASGVKSIELPRPGERDFIQTFEDALGEPLTPGEQELLRQIARAEDCIPLCAVYVADCVRGRPDRARALADYLRADPSAPAPLDEPRTQSIAKLWRHLGVDDRTRVALVAVLGEPGLPASWLPPGLQPRAHVRAPLLTLTSRDDGQHVEAHRLAARYAREMGTPTLLRTLHDLLESWVADERLLGEFKTGARARALARGYRYLTERRGDEPLHPSARLLKTFVDTAEPADSESLPRHLACVVDGPQALARLPLEVVGEIYDHIPRGAHGDARLRELRETAFDLLAKLARSGPPVAHDDDTRSDADASAMHHAAKVLLKRGKRDEQTVAVARFRELEQRCLALLPRSPRYATHLARVRLQLAQSEHLTPAERRALFAQMLADPSPLPGYLRLAIVTAALDLQPDTTWTDAEQRGLIRQGLELCKPEVVLETRAHFLRVAAAACERTAAPGELSRTVARTAVALIGLAKERALGDSDAAALGQAVVKVASQDPSAEGAEWIFQALELYAVFLDRSEFVLNRLAVAVRELGFPEESRPIAAAQYGRPRDDRDRYFKAFDLSKALRGMRRYAEALRVVRRERERCADRPNELAALGDEYVKSAVRDPALRDEVRTILAANVDTYRAARRLAFAHRCERWLADLDLDPASEGGLAEDEWRAHRRRAHLSDDARRRVIELARRAAARPEIAALADRPVDATSSSS